MRLLIRAAGFVAVAWAAGCNNPCQQVCLEMASYAEECNLTVTNDAIDACREGYSDASSEELDQCRGWNEPDQIREWWSCEDVSENFLDGGS